MYGTPFHETTPADGSRSVTVRCDSARGPNAKDHASSGMRFTISKSDAAEVCDDFPAL